MKIDTDEQKIQDVLTRGVDEGIGIDRLGQRMRAGEKLRIKLGIDPTSPDLHVGRAVSLLKLRAFQDLGHEAILIVGNATGVIGDTSDKEAERPMLTDADVEKNMHSYKEQAGKILDLAKTTFLYNADWLHMLGYKEIGKDADAFSLHDFIMRENIKKRLDAGKRVSLREVLYPLMQGYDSVHVRADVELGGRDQRFNLLAGRLLQEKHGQEPQAVIMSNLIMGTDGRKMSSSWGNTIALTDPPRVMGEKLMNLPDDQVATYFMHCTRVTRDDIQKLLQEDDPRKQKIALARAMIALYYGQQQADEVVAYLEKTFISKEGLADTLETLSCTAGASLLDVLVSAGAAKSKSDARRKIEQGGVTLQGEKILDPTYTFTREHHRAILKVGKKFLRVVDVIS